MREDKASSGCFSLREDVREKREIQRACSNLEWRQAKDELLPQGGGVYHYP